MQNASRFTGYDRNAGKRWRREDISQLRMLVRKGTPLRLISLRLGRPDAAIRSKARALNLTLETGDRIVAPAPARTLTRRTTPAPIGAATRQLELFGVS